MTTAPAWRSVWITGASTGIGRELALRLAREGATVAASARSPERLAEVSRLAPRIVPYPVDVTDVEGLAAVVERIEAAQGSIDLAILNAGVWQPMGASSFDAATVARTMDVNFLGTTNALSVLLPGMIARKAGHVALMASIAGYRGMPRGAAYAPSKAAVISLAETLKPDLERKAVRVSFIAPGYVDTPMTAKNRFPMPFQISAQDAGERIVRGLHRGKFEIAFPWQMVALMKCARLLPYPAFFWLERMLLTSPRQGENDTLKPPQSPQQAAGRAD